MVQARFSGLVLFSAYTCKNSSALKFGSFLADLEKAVRPPPSNGVVIWEGDFDVKSPSWDSSVINNRGIA